MSQQINFGSSGQTYNNPTPINTGGNIFNYALSGNQPQPVTITTGGSRVQPSQVYTENVQVGGVYRTDNYSTAGQVQTGAADNYGYGYSTDNYYGSATNKQGLIGTTATIGQYGASYQPVSGANYQAVSGNNYVSNGTNSFTVKPANITFGRQGATTAAQTVNYVSTVQPVTTTYVQPVTTTYVQPATTTYVQPATTTYVQPAVYTQQQAVYVQPAQQIATSYVATQPVGNQWVEEQFERPKYPKLYNNSAQYYRNLAPEEDPAIKKSCCSPCCWVLWGLLGLLAAVFGILCGLGILCGGFGFGLPKLSVPSIPTPTIPDISTPNITIPDIPTPNITIPVIPTPNITIPDITTPNITFPNITTPNITFPDITTPNITFPNITTPNITFPQIPVVPIIPVAPTVDDGDFIDPTVVAKVPVVSTTQSTTSWTAPETAWSSTWSADTSASTSYGAGTTYGAGAAYGSSTTYGSGTAYGTDSTYVDNSYVDNSYIDPSVTSKVPVYTTVPTTTYSTDSTVTYPSNTYSTSYDSSYGYSLGYTPASVQPDSNLLTGTTSNTWTPSYIDPSNTEFLPVA